MNFKEYLIEMAKVNENIKISSYSTTISTHLIKLLYFNVTDYEVKGWLHEINTKIQIINDIIHKSKSKFSEKEILSALLRFGREKSQLDLIGVKYIIKKYSTSPEYAKTGHKNITNVEIYDIMVKILTSIAKALYENKNSQQKKPIDVNTFL